MNAFSVATVYVCNRVVGPYAVSLSLTTDGTIGTIQRTNITDYAITLSFAAASFTLTPTNSIYNNLSKIFISNTDGELVFDFDAPGNGIFFRSSNRSYEYCLISSGTCGSGSKVEQARFDGIAVVVAQTGQQVVARATAVPEPATWAMFIGGFGLVGVAMRRRQLVALSFS